MKEIIFFDHKLRGTADHGWLKANHTFSFASYYDPNRMGFGTLRVLNDDFIAPGMGFGTHPHDNMEIITIPLEGSLNHKDSMGHESLIRHGEVQVMSAGTGITHSEFNGSPSIWLNLFQLWVLPKNINVTPRYDQKAFNFDTENEWISLVTSMENPLNPTALQVNQDVEFQWATLSPDAVLNYSPRYNTPDIFVMSVNGDLSCDGHSLQARDAIGITKATALSLQALSKTQILVIEMKH